MSHSEHKKRGEKSKNASRVFSRTNSQVRINARIASGARQILVFLVWDMEMGSGVSVLFGESKVNDIDLISAPPQAHQEIIWLNVSMEKVFRMYEFYPGNLLYL